MTHVHELHGKLVILAHMDHKGTVQALYGRADDSSESPTYSPSEDFVKTVSMPLDSLNPKPLFPNPKPPSP